MTQALFTRSTWSDPATCSVAALFHALNLVDVGSHRVDNEILTELGPLRLAESLVRIWSRVGLSEAARFDSHTNFRGAIPPARQHFSPIVAACLDLWITPRFISLREPLAQRSR